jgi:cyclophilin family peptidyl-prolyl cis-trans isomerase
MQNKNIILVLLLVPFIIVAAVLILSAKPNDGTSSAGISNDFNNTTQQSTPSSEPSQSAPESADQKTMQKPTMEIDKTKQYTAVLNTTAGKITISLHANETPITVNNFVYLAKKGFYDNTIFHRVIKDFMIQGGDPSGDGSGGPGYSFEDEPFTGDYKRGVVAMANRGPNTNGSQFFIMHADQALPKNYVIFGEVTEGLDTVDKIAGAPVTTNAMGEKAKPITPVVVNSVEIIEK